MAEIVTMPKLGFDMAEGTLIRWVIQEGEPVQKGAVLAEIETDKATVEVESAYEGIISKHLVPAGEIVPVNTPIAIVAAPGESPESVAAASPTAIPAVTPSPAPSEPATPAGTPATAPAPVETGQLPVGVKASPLARKMASDMHINIQAVHGTGPGGRIIKRDVQSYMTAPAAQAAPSVAAVSTAATGAAPAPAAKPAPPLIPVAPLPSTPTPADEIVPLKRLRAAIGRRMVEAKQQVPHFYVTHEYDVAGLLDLRKQANALLEDGDKISVNDFIIKATALALRQFPNLNASLQGDQIVRHGAVNIGVAVAVEGGLLTVVCHDADRKPLRQIAQEVRKMAGRAREGKVRPEDIEGSTFSISNLGMFDVEQFAAIINPPEAAILAVSSAREIPVVKDGQIQPGWRMKATISVDHRVSDGAEAARFMQSLTAYIEQPLRLLV
jgi:pyruvate dehydrogenase E2 component (dihydrolipoamide acetyltransferase)